MLFPNENNKNTSILKRIKRHIKNGTLIFRLKQFPGSFVKPRIDVADASQKPQKERLLFLVWSDPDGVGTIHQTIEEVIRLSKYPIDVLNMYVYYTYRWSFGIDIDRYSAVIVHNTLSYTVDGLRMLDRLGPKKLFEYSGIKIMMKQDEHYRISQIAQYLGQNNFDLLLTLCNEENVRSFYPKDITPHLQFMQYLTGYVPKKFRNLKSRPFARRSIDIGYRGSVQPVLFGRLCWEKETIGESIRPHAERHGLKTDISSRWKDRFMGDAWLDFLGNCKATLGVESGSDIVDKDGQVEVKLNGFIRNNPKATDTEILEFLAPYEGILTYRAIAPRHFEAAACKTVQILFEGNYQGIFHANRHYIPLKRDFSNVDEVLNKLQDERFCVNMTECAFEEIIMNDKYSFERFVENFDKKLEAIFAMRQAQKPVAAVF
jgi:hypothetical protein